MTRLQFGINPFARATVFLGDYLQISNISVQVYLYARILINSTTRWRYTVSTSWIAASRYRPEDHTSRKYRPFGHDFLTTLSLYTTMVTLHIRHTDLAPGDG